VVVVCYGFGGYFWKVGTSFILKDKRHFIADVFTYLTACYSFLLTNEGASSQNSHQYQWTNST
jgi:hypothetical protein